MLVSKEDIRMPYSVKSKKDGTEYYLHASTAANGKTKLYYFSKNVKDGVLEAVPEGYEISENGNTGLPILKKKVS
jgi:hypothetical protein